MTTTKNGLTVRTQVNEVTGCRPKAWTLKAKAKAWTFKAKAKDLQTVLKESLRPRTKAKDNNTAEIK